VADSEGTAPESRSLRVGVEAEPQLHDLAERIADDLRDDLERRFPEIAWRVEFGAGKPNDPQARIAELVQDARQLLLENGWDLIVCLTDIPLSGGARGRIRLPAIATDRRRCLNRR